MTVPRSEQINLEATPYYHIMSRCVRRGFLCGDDYVTGKNYDHRKGWIVDRMKHLTEIFAINIASYAVMSNHFHLVVHIDENQANNWSVDELKDRWRALYPRDAEKLDRLIKNGAPEKEIEDRIKEIRIRLSSISWFMRCLNEPIAKASNIEDKVKGRFWEGRFKSQALLDEAALLTAMTYVDLNPIRAGVKSTPEESEFTSIYERIKEVAKQAKKTDVENANKPTISAKEIAEICDDKTTKQPYFLMPIKLINHCDNENSEESIDIKLSDYIDLVDFTGRHEREDKKGAIPDHLKPILERLQLTESGWFDMSKNIEKDFVYAIGSKEKLDNFHESNNRRINKGKKFANDCYLRVLA